MDKEDLKRFENSLGKAQMASQLNFFKKRQAQTQFY